MTWDEIKKLHPWLPESSEGWHQHANGGGWVRDAVKVPDAVVVGERALIEGGAICGGTIWGGTIRGGTIWGGTIRGGTITFSPLLIFGSRYFVGYAGDGLVASGCIVKPLAWWLENVERCAEEHGYTPIEQREHRMHIEHIAAWMRLYGLAVEAAERSEG
ncbi:MAG: hypothetical protein WC277_07150 [Bacilli bacterium]